MGHLSMAHSLIALCVVFCILATIVPSVKAANTQLSVQPLHFSFDRQLLHAEDKDESKEEKSKDIVDVDDQHDKSQGEENAKGTGDGGITLKKVDVGNTGFTHAFVASLSVIIVSEIGDKTFFIAAIMAMSHSRMTVLMGALTALFVMTFLSAIVGYAATVIPRALTYYASSALFAIFGLKMLREGWYMSDDEGKEEYEEVQADLKRREDELKKLLEDDDSRWEDNGLSDSIQKQNMPVQDIETGIIRTPGRRFLSGILSTVFLQSLTLTFLAEWGDRSQISTIILGAREDVFGVMLGGFLGHSLCTGLAVLGGRFVAQRISVRTVTLIGGVVFILFALSALWIGPEVGQL